MIPFPEWTPDRPPASSGLQKAKGCYAVAGGYRGMPTLGVTTSAFSGICIGVFSAPSIAGNPQTYLGTASKLYQRDGEDWDDVSQGGGYTIASDDRWEFWQWGDNVYAASRSDLLQKQTGATGTFADVSGGPKANCLFRIGQFLVVGDVYDSTNVPHRVRWSAIGNPDDWPTAGSGDAQEVQSGQQDLDLLDGAVKAIRGFDFGIVVQERAITRMTYVGAPIVWQFDRIDSRGSKYPGSVVQVGRRVYFLGDDGWYVTDGSGESQPVGHGRIDRWFFDNFDPANGAKISGAHDPVRGLIVWAFPSVNSGGSNDMLLVYNYREDRWTYDEQAAEKVYLGFPPAYTLDSIDSLYSSADDIDLSADAAFWSASRPALSAIVTTYGYQFEGEPGTAELQTGVLALNEGARSMLTDVRPIVDGTCTIEVAGRVTYDGTATTYGPFTPSTTHGRATMRVNAFFHQLTFYIAGQFNRAAGFELYQKRVGLK